MNTSNNNPQDHSGHESLSNYENRQQEIQFRKMKLKHKTGWWHDYPYRSVESIMHWLYVYGNVDIAQRVTIHEYSLELHGITIACFTFSDEEVMPLFSFIDQYSWLQERQSEYLGGLKKALKKVA